MFVSTQRYIVTVFMTAQIFQTNKIVLVNITFFSHSNMSNLISFCVLCNIFLVWKSFEVRFFWFFYLCPENCVCIFFTRLDEFHTYFIKIFIENIVNIYFVGGCKEINSYWWRADGWETENECTYMRCLLLGAWEICQSSVSKFCLSEFAS